MRTCRGTDKSFGIWILAAIVLALPLRVAAQTTDRPQAPSGSLSGDRIVFAASQPDGTSAAYYQNAPFTGEPVRIDVNDVGLAVADGALHGVPRLSGNGRFVAFSSTANLDGTTGDTPGSADLFVRDLSAGRTERLTLGAGLTGGASISADGRYLAFATVSQLLPEDFNTASDVYLIDRARPQSPLRLLTSPAQSVAATDATISAGGSAVAFTSPADGLVAGDSNGLADVFVVDLRAGTTVRVSVVSDANGESAAASFLSISGNGRRVAFANTTTGDVYVRDLNADETWPVTGNGNGTLAPDGRTIDGVDVQLPPDVPAGSTVRGDPFDSVAGQNPVTVVFRSVAAAGNVSIAIRNGGPALPAGFSPASPYFELSTEAISSNGALICVNDIVGDPGTLRVLHFGAAGWTDVTVIADAVPGAVCGQASTLGTLVLASPIAADDEESTSSKDKKQAGVLNVVSWNVDADGFWDEPANWSGGVPGDGDTVIIDRPAGDFVITVRNPTANVASLSANEQVNVTSVLTIAGTGSFNGGLFLSGHLMGTGTAVLNSNSMWHANSDTIIGLTGGVDVMAATTLTINAGANQTHYLIDSSLRNHGTVLWAGGGLHLRNGSPVTNDAGHLWDIQGDFAVGSDGIGTPTFTNLGTLRKSGGGGPLTLGGAVLFSSSGTLDLQSGSIAVGGAAQLTNSGLMQVAATTTFLLDRVTLLASSTFGGLGTLHANGLTTITGVVSVTAPLVVTAQVTGAGTLQLAAATLWHADSDTIISVTGGVDVMAATTLTINAGANQTHYLIDSSLRNHGTVLWAGGGLHLRNGSPVTNDAGHLWDIQGDFAVGSDGIGTPTFTNLGTLRKSGGGGPLTLGGAVLFSSSGTLDLQSGSIAVGGAAQLTNSGLMQVAATTTFLLDRVTLLASSTFGGLGTLHANGLTTITGVVSVTAPLVVTAQVTGAGTLQLAAATLWHADSDTIISVTGGVDVMAATTLTINAGANQTHYLIDSSLRNHGTVLWAGGGLHLRNGSPVTNDAGHLWDIQGDFAVGSDGIGTPTFTNLGTLRKSGGGGPLTLGGAVLFSSSGTLDLQSGSIAVGGAAQLTNSGLMQVAATTIFLLDRVTLLASSTFGGLGTLHANGLTTITGVVTVTAPLVVTAQVTGAGTLQLAAATLWHADSDTIISVTGGVDVMAATTLTINAGANQTHYLIDSSLRNHGTVLWAGGGLHLRNGSPVTNDAGHLWDIQGDFAVGSDGIGTPTFTNLGTLRKSGGGGPLTLGGAVLFSSSGTLDLQSGSIAVGGAAQLTNSGLMQVAATTTFLLDRVTLLASSTFGGLGTLHANGLTTITGVVSVTAPLVVTAQVTGAGTLQLAAATLWHADSDTIISVTGGVDVMAATTLTINAGANQTHYLIDSSLRNHGTVLWAGGGLHLRNGSPVTNDAGGVWDIQISFSVGSDGTGTPSFVNNGILQRTGAPNRLTMNVPFTNTGTFDVRIGGAGGGQLDEFGGNVVNLGGTLSVHLINGLSPSPSDQFKVMDYTSIAGAFATVTGDGFTSADACYTPNAVFVCSIVTTKLTPTITWNDPADIFFGTALSATQLNAMASVPGTFVYTPAAATILNAGNNQLLEVTFTPTDTVHYNNATASVHINVVRATPIITWANPAAIVYGTALSATQLNATADVAGTFLYSPAATVVLHAGNNQLLSTTFTPTDIANYEPASASAFINVLSAPLAVTAANAAKVFGAPLPSFSANFSGFVNGDTPAHLIGTLLLSTTATASSPAGSYPIVPSGVSSPDYIITFLPGTLTITRANTSTTLYVLPATTGLLQPIVLVAVIAPIAPGAGVPDGVVQFMDGATLLGPANVTSGFAYILTNGLAPGAHTMTAVYDGSSNFAGSTSAPGGTTVRPAANSTFTLLVPTINPQAAGLPATLAALVIPLGGGTPTGSVQFSEGNTVIGTANIAGGVATISPTTLGVGPHLLTARYVGNATFAGSASPVAALTIYSGARPSATTTALIASPSPSTLGQSVTFTATVTGGATTGSVNFYSDGLLIGSGSLVNVGGSFKASLPTQTLATGVHVISASYVGSPGFASSNSAPGLHQVQAAGASLTGLTLPSLEQARKLTTAAR